MTTQSSTISQPTNYTLCNPYTGTLEQPDTVNLFLKTGKKLDIFNENIINSLGYSPLNYFRNLPPTLWRIEEAVQKIFANLKGERGDLFNALKNLGRGIIQLFPIVGGPALYLYDQVKQFLYGYPEIQAVAGNEQRSVLGIAFDGKVIATFTLQEFNNRVNQNGTQTDPKGSFVQLKYMWLKMLADSNPSTTRHEIALRLSNYIKRV